jgi:signal transduction histidine kinase
MMPGAGIRPYRGAVRTRLVDLGVAAIPLVLGLVGPGRHDPGWTLSLSAAFGVPLYWRRGHPLPVLLATFAVGFIQLADPGRLLGFYDFGIIIAIYSAVSYGSWWVKLVAVAGGIGGAIAAALVWLGPRMSTQNMMLVLSVLLTLVLLAWALGVAARTRRAYLASLVERAERLEREREALARVAVATERERIARELHDIVAHSVSLMVVASDGADAAMDQENLTEVRKAIAAIGRTGRDALTELRLLLGVLRGDHALTEPQPGTGQLKDLVDSVPVTAALTVGGTPRELPQGLALAAFRIVQEALTNTVKHAGPGASADVRLNYGDGAREIQGTDDGRGRDRVQEAGHGLIGMRERVAMFGGTLTAGPHSSGGFRVRALIPWT